MVEWQRFRFLVAGAALLSARVASGQTEPKRPEGPGALAEQRMKAGDCAGALDAFDLALQSGTQPTLERDRGVCHERLGHPFPAIEDYRAYVTARPNAADADAVRARIASLEQQVGIIRPGQASPTGAAVSVSIGGDTNLGESTGGDGSGLDTIERNEQLDARANGSPLRRGMGLVLGVVVDARHYSDTALGWAELLGLDLRFSFSRLSTVFVDVSVESAKAGGSATALSGPGFLAGYEARIPLNARLDDAILLGASVGYQNLSQGSTGFAYGVFEPLGRAGYRHVFGPSFGLEAILDAGPAFERLTGGVTVNSTSFLAGGHIALLLGF